MAKFNYTLTTDEDQVGLDILQYFDDIIPFSGEDYND